MRASRTPAPAVAPPCPEKCCHVMVEPSSHFGSGAASTSLQHKNARARRRAPSPADVLAFRVTLSSEPQLALRPTGSVGRKAKVGRRAKNTRQGVGDGMVFLTTYP